MSKQYGLAIDLERCIGCHTCTIACKLENGFEEGSGIRVETIGGSHQDTPEGSHPQLSMHFLPVLCMHCDQPPCRDVCPTQAIYKRENGIVLIDEDRCDGCMICLGACPYDALVYDVQTKIVRKCTLCAHRLDDGEEPFCLVCCETEAIHFGDVNNPKSSISKFIKQRNASSIESNSETALSVYYCPTRHGRIK